MRYDDFPESFMNEDKKLNLTILDKLPRRLLAKAIVTLHKSSTLMEDLPGTPSFFSGLLN